jgi:hypothetical protein
MRIRNQTRYTFHIKDSNRIKDSVYPNYKTFEHDLGLSIGSGEPKLVDFFTRSVEPLSDVSQRSVSDGGDLKCRGDIAVKNAKNK